MHSFDIVDNALPDHSSWKLRVGGGDRDAPAMAEPSADLATPVSCWPAALRALLLALCRLLMLCTACVLQLPMSHNCFDSHPCLRHLAYLQQASHAGLLALPALPCCRSRAGPALPPAPPLQQPPQRQSQRPRLPAAARGAAPSGAVPADITGHRPITRCGGSPSHHSIARPQGGSADTLFSSILEGNAGSEAY